MYAPYSFIVITFCFSYVLVAHLYLCFFFFFNDTATPEISPLPLPAALPISGTSPPRRTTPEPGASPGDCAGSEAWTRSPMAPSSGSPTAATSSGRRATTSPSLSRQRSEEHTSELQSRSDLVCRLLLEKKKKN